MSIPQSPKQWFQFILMFGFFTTFLFYTNYRLFDDILVASTGYNSSTQGWFTWSERYAEHHYNRDGVWEIKEGGTKISRLALLKELALCMILSFTITSIIFVLIHRKQYE